LQFLISRRFGFSEEAMESPEGWDLLISSLAVCDLQKPAAVWAFLAVQGLVRNQPGDRIAFFKIVHKVRTKSPSTSSSRARRIAERLRLKGMALPLSDTPDPKGEIALERRHLMDLWTKSFVQTGEKPQPRSLTEAPPEAIQKMFTLCNYCYNVFELSEQHVCTERRDVEQPNKHVINVFCDACNRVNRPDARFCRGCGNPFNAPQSFRFHGGDSQTSSPVDQNPIEVIWEPGNYDSRTPSPSQETDRCFFDILNSIRELKTTKGLSKKPHKR
jgi:hypothetical protein